jgi:osmotically-inducible protein OsmY
MRNALLFAMSTALIGFTGCNKSSQEKASEKSAEVRQDADKAMQDIKEEAQKAAEKVQAQAREATNDIKENAADARKKISNEADKAGNTVNNATTTDERRADRDVRNDTREVKNGTRTEARQTDRDVNAEARQTNRDAQTEARQTNRDLHEGLGMDQGKTEADRKLNDRIRAALKNDKQASRDAGDVTLETVNGHVKLKGTVASEDAKKDVASVARKVAGLTHVSNDIKVAERVGQGSND